MIRDDQCLDEVIASNIESRMDSDLNQIAPRALAVITEALADVSSKEARLQPVGGGSTKGAWWSDAYEGEEGGILAYFERTLDKFNPAELDKCSKELKQAAITTHLCLSQMIGSTMIVNEKPRL